MKILIDLSILKNVNCGLGQVALNCGYFFRDKYVAEAGQTIYLLVPKHFVGAFGNKVKYIQARKIYRIMPWLMGIRFDVWHAIHQLSRFRPFARHYVLTIHDFNFVYEKRDNHSKVRRYLSRIQKKVDKADRLVCISDFTKSETEHFIDLKGKPIEVIYNGIERIESLLPEPMSDIKSPFFFTIGEVKEKKNFHVLLKMMNLLPEYHLYIAGNDTTPYADKIRSIISERQISNVHLMGVVSQEQKVWLYNNCCAILFPSLFEGFGLPILEAMLFRKPVICSAATSLTEIGGKYVDYFPKDYDAENSVGIIRQAMDKPAEYLNDAYEYACSFSWEENISRYLSIYQSLE